MIVECFSAPALFLHDPRACLCISQGPLDNPVLEQLVEKVLEPIGEVATASVMSQATDAIEYLPDCHGCKTEPFICN